MSLPKVINQTLSKKKPDTLSDNEVNNKQLLLISFVSNMLSLEPNDCIHAKATTATSLAQQQKKKIIPLEDLIPKAYPSYLYLFDKKSSECFLESGSWDHKIEMKEDFQPKVFKKYNLSLIKQQEYDKFINENLAKEYIVQSQSQQHSHSSLSVKKNGSF